MALPIEKTQYAVDLKPLYKWPDDEFGYDLESVYSRDYHEREIAGADLLFAWEVVNSLTPLVESNGKVYWIAVIVPEISPF